MSKELRCESKMHGILIRDGVLEVKCNSGFCGSKPGVVVLHRFSMDNGELVETVKFKDTPKLDKKGRVA